VTYCTRCKCIVPVLFRDETDRQTTIKKFNVVGLRLSAKCILSMESRDVADRPLLMIMFALVGTI
jgi:hypothetical protein